MRIHDLAQGSPEWQAFRLNHHGASEAAVMLGLSTKATRSDLLRIKHTGIPREFSDWVQENIFDHGHRAEAMARPLVEEIIGEDLYPVTGSDEDEGGHLSASCDGLTMLQDTAFEHKQWNAELAASVAAGIVPDEHLPQCQQVMMITGASRVIFTVSDGTKENFVYTEVYPDEKWFARIRAGWAQLDRDLADYELPDAQPAVVAEAVSALPAVMVQISGQIDVRENFKVFEAALRDFLDNRLIREPQTDQEFADLDLQIKAMKKAEDMLDGAEAMMLAQIQTVDQAKRQKDMLVKLVRDNRLMAEKLMASEKERRRAEKVVAARKAYTNHIAELQRDIIDLNLPLVMPDFAAAIKGLKTMTSIQDKLDTALANAKSEADTLAADWRAKMNWFRDNVEPEYRALFRDLDDLISMAAKHFEMTVVSRVDQHIKAEESRLEAQREQIRAEEAAKLQDQQQQPAGLFPAVEQPAPDTVATPQTKAAPATRYVAPAGLPTLRLGQINERLAPISLTADGLASLGFPHAATDKAARLYRESQFPNMCAALVEHIQKAQKAISAPATSTATLNA